MEDDRLLSLVEAAEIAERSPERLRQYIRDGRLKAELVGKTYAVRESVLRRLMDARFEPKKPGPRPGSKRPRRPRAP